MFPRFPVDKAAQPMEQRMTRRVLYAVIEVEPIIEVGCVLADQMLKHCFELVEAFCEDRFGGRGRTIFIPKRDDFVAEVAGQRRA